MELVLAQRRLDRLRIAVCGYMGGGKSTTAHLIARGLAPGAPPIVIDTENSHGLCAPLPGEVAKPPHTFDFYPINMDPPYSPVAFYNVLTHVVPHRPKVVIVDTITSEWFGEGGMHDLAEANAVRGNQHAGWGIARGQQRAFMRAWATQFPFHIIFCVRTREKTALVVGDDGKKEVVSMGYRAQCDDDLLYECGVRVNVRQRGQRGGGWPDAANIDVWRLPAGVTLPNDQQISESFGAALATFCGGNAPKEPKRDETSDTDKTGRTGNAKVR